MKTSKTFSILFWINASRAKNNEAEIYARITVDRKRVNISLKHTTPTYPNENIKIKQ